MINQEEYEILKGLDDKYKWVARDSGDDLWAYKERPFKGTFYWVPIGSYCGKLPSGSERLFQFIQWEDKEPHSIAELIEEYEDSKEYKDILVIEYFLDKEKRSEEIEVKNKEWLKEEIEEELKGWEAIDRRVDESVIEGVLYCVDQLDEPEVPVVPEDVYEHIKMNKIGGVPLDIALEGAIGNLEILWGDGVQFHEFRNNQDNYAKAWLAYPNIEVEKEPLYYVLDKNEVPLLIKLVSDSAVKRANTYYTIKETNDSKFYQLTEQEIKDYDERFWAFAVPVEEQPND